MRKEITALLRMQCEGSKNSNAQKESEYMGVQT